MLISGISAKAGIQKTGIQKNGDFVIPAGTKLTQAGIQKAGIPKNGDFVIPAKAGERS